MSEIKHKHPEPYENVARWNHRAALIGWFLAIIFFHLWMYGEG